MSLVNPDEVILNWDAALHEDEYLATSDGEKLSLLKSFCKSEKRLAKVFTLKAAKRQGSCSCRKLAKRETREHQRIARARRDHAFKTAYRVLRTGKTIFIYKNLNLKGLSKCNSAKQDE
ncbi:MAG: hypothetical protein Q6L68_06345 [Thermostichus sp. DG02_5_bins_236]